MRVKRSKNINTLVRKKKNINRRLVHGAVHGNLILNLRLNQMVICGATNYRGQCERKDKYECFHNGAQFGLTKKAEPPPTRDVNRDSGTDSANGG
jgi:hypothetical protein